MKRLALVTALAVAATFTLAAQTPAPELSKEMKAVQGTWVITMANGQSVEGQAPEVRMEITGDKYAQVTNGQVVERGTMKIDGSKTPMAIDLMIQEGDDANKTQLGVIKIGDGVVTGKLASPGSPDRPKDFEPADGFFAFTAKKLK